MLTTDPLLFSSLLLCIVVLTLIGAILWPVAVVRTAINKNLTDTQKIIWILAELFLFPVMFFYLLFVDKNRFLKILSGMVTAGIFIALLIPDIRQTIIASYGSSTDQQAFHQKLFQRLKDDDTAISSAALCQACISPEKTEIDLCLSHVRMHLAIAKSESPPLYCSQGQLTAAMAKAQVAAWCTKMGPNYAFPTPRWKMINAALSEKYSCNGSPPAKTGPP